MKILICGAGRVGQGIARRLIDEGHDLTLIDADRELVDQVSTALDVRGVVGHAAHPSTLKEAGAEHVEMIIAVTLHDEINMIICQVAHSLFHVPTKICRIRQQAYLDPAWADLFKRQDIPIDLVISPEIEVGDAVLQRFQMPNALMSRSFAAGRVQVVGLDVQAGSPLVDTALDQIGDLFPDLSARVIGVGRGERVFAPRGNTKLAPGDRAYIGVKTEHMDRLNALFNQDAVDVSHAVIVGGGNVGLYVASVLERRKSTRIRLIERSEEQATLAAGKLRRTIVINGDGLDKSILDEAGISKTDYIIALTDDDKTNLLIANLAKRNGAKRALALVNSLDLAALAKDMRVDGVLDPRALTVSKILLNLRRGRFISLHSIENGKAEVAEGLISKTSPLADRSMRYDDMPDGVVVAAVQRGKDILFPKKDRVMRVGDKPILFFEQSRIRQVEKFFRIRADYF